MLSYTYQDCVSRSALNPDCLGNTELCLTDLGASQHVVLHDRSIQHARRCSPPRDPFLALGTRHQPLVHLERGQLMLGEFLFKLLDLLRSQDLVQEHLAQDG